jgi:hypothetical protein
MNNKVKLYEPDGCEYCSGSMGETEYLGDSLNDFDYVRYTDYQKLESKLEQYRKALDIAESALIEISADNVIAQATLVSIASIRNETETK